VIDEDEPGNVEASDDVMHLVIAEAERPASDAPETRNVTNVTTVTTVTSAPSADLKDKDREKVLAAAARGGDADAFEELVRRRTPGVLAFLRRMLGDAEDARDVAQLTFVRVWENLGRYDSSWAFSTWLFRIAGNLAIDALRSRRTRLRTESETLRLVHGGRSGETVEPDGPLGLEREEVLRVFAACATVLSEKQKMVFVLREIEEKESRDIAEILGCRESTVRNHLFQARRLLRDEVRRRFPEFAPRSTRGTASEVPEVEA
jgi:RNA polymerase sigma-70 factor (ECF subfamily)